jgi:serine/threonine-protein kinase
LDAIWCATVDDRPLAPKSKEAMIATETWGMDKFQINFSMTLTTLDESDPGASKTFQTTSDFVSPDCDHIPIPFPLNGGSLEGETGWNCTNDGHCHAVIMDTKSGFLYEQLRAMDPDSANPYQGGCMRRWQPAEMIGSLSSDFQCRSASSDGQPIWPTVLTPEQVMNDSIDHVLRFVLPLNMYLAEHQFVYPATHATNATAKASAMLPYGAWLRLKWTDADIDDWVTMNKPGNVYVGRILRALRKYGMTLSESGSEPLRFANDANRSVKWAEMEIDSDSLVGTPPIKPTDFDWVVPPGVEPETFQIEAIADLCQRIPLSE